MIKENREMITANSDSITLYQKLCEAVEEIETLRRERDEARERLSPLLPIGDRLRTQDNRCTADPMFCVQILVREIGYDSAWSDSLCWVDGANEIVVYDDDPDFKEPTGKEWDCFGYKDRWETVMVAFTEEGCKRYLDLNGHNDRRRAHRGQVRIYADVFRRCPEMLAIREFLEATYEPADIPARDEALDAKLITADESLYAAKCIEVYATITPEGIEDLWPPEIQRIIHEMREVGERLNGKWKP